jgi:hypothetical protein
LTEQPLVAAVTVRVIKKPKVMPKTQAVIVENYQTHLRFQEVLTIAEKLAFELRDVSSRRSRRQAPGFLFVCR